MSASDPSDVGLLSPATADTAAPTGDRAVVQAMIRTEAALLHALTAVGIAPPLPPLPDITVDVQSLALDAVHNGNPVTALLDRLRAATDEPTRSWLHHGATSQDIIDTALMLVAADVLRQLNNDLTALAERLARLVGDSRAVSMVARTLTQQATPTTLGFRAAGWLAGVADALRAVRTCSLPASLGGPAGTLAAYGEHGPAVLEAFATALRLDPPLITWHTRRTPVLQLAHVLTMTTAACGKIATDVLVMSQTEIGEVHDTAAGASSAMPHKANPIRAVLVVAAARQAPALAAVVTTSAGTAEQDRPAGAWHAEWQPLRALLRLAGGAVHHTLAMQDQLRFDHRRMRDNLETLRAATGAPEPWVQDQTAHTGVWIDRVLADYLTLRG